VKEPVVADSTCLIALERIGALNILPAFFEPIFIPPQVEREFGLTLPWLKLESSTNTALITSLELLLDKGEAEAIALAKEREIPIILDDRQARSVARDLNLRVIGTLGCLLKAKQAGEIAEVRPFIEKLERAGFFLATALRTEALRLAGE